ncbi:hypothetical protein ACOMHN_060416 [Nucella lapillus]
MSHSRGPMVPHMDHSPWSHTWVTAVGPWSHTWIIAHGPTHGSQPMVPHMGHSRGPIVPHMGHSPWSHTWVTAVGPWFHTPPRTFTSAYVSLPHFRVAGPGKHGPVIDVCTPRIPLLAFPTPVKAGATIQSTRGEKRGV